MPPISLLILAVVTGWNPSIPAAIGAGISKTSCRSAPPLAVSGGIPRVRTRFWIVYFREATFNGHREFGGARFRKGLWANSPVLLEALQGRGVRLRTDIDYVLPEGWGLAPDPTNPVWGHLVDSGAAGQV